MVAISKVVNFRTRLSLSEILSDLIRCKLVRYPWFCSARPRSFTCFKMADVYHAYWSKFPSQSEASIRFLFRDQVCFSTSLLNLMYLSIFVRVAKKSCVISKVYAFDSACFYCCVQSLKKVHQVFLFAMRFQLCRPYLIDVFRKVLRWQMMPIEAKFQSYVAFVARSRL